MLPHDAGKRIIPGDHVQAILFSFVVYELVYLLFKIGDDDMRFALLGKPIGTTRMGPSAREKKQGQGE